MRNPLRRGRGRRRYSPDTARATNRRLAADLATSEEAREWQDAHIRDLTNRLIAATSRADQAEIVVTCLTRILDQRNDTELAAITQRAPIDQRPYDGDRTIETAVLALPEAPDTVARPYAPRWPQVRLLKPVTIGRYAATHPAHIPGLPADHATTRVLPAAKAVTTS
ncbi:MAG: hypothetical protein HOV68_23715 [Streptomycetaceae bacterium]|nr:hypothetical protein [Streptomycetaceae bacterium]